MFPMDMFPDKSEFSEQFSQLKSYCLTSTVQEAIRERVVRLETSTLHCWAVEMRSFQWSIGSFGLCFDSIWFGFSSFCCLFGLRSFVV